MKRARTNSKDVDEILRLIRKGHTTRDVAQMTGWSQATVIKHARGRGPRARQRVITR